MTFDRLLESGSLRLIQSGDTRVLEASGPPVPGFPGPLEGVEVHVALGFYDANDPLHAWDVAEWVDVVYVPENPDLGLWAGGAPLVDISCDVVSVAISAGRDQPLDRFRAGTATVELDDPDGAFSPWRYATDADRFAGVRPGIDLYVWVVAGGDTYPRFRGIVDSIVDEWPEQSAEEGTPHRVTFHAIDAFAALAAFNGLEVPPIGAGELTGARVGRIVANAGLDVATDIDAGTITVQATTLASAALEEAGLTTDTERGALFVDRAGTLVFRDRNGLLTNDAYTTVQATIGDDPTDGGPCYSRIALASDASKIRNQVTVSRAGGSVATAQDLTSQALYGTRTYRRLDLIHTSDADSPTIANEYLTTYAYAANRVESLTVELVANQDHVPPMLGLDVLHLIEVRRRAEGFEVVAKLQIQAFAERITSDAWTIELQTFAALPSNIFRVARWTDAVTIPEIEDQWDSGLWGY